MDVKRDNREKERGEERKEERTGLLLSKLSPPLSLSSSIIMSSEWD